jgi:hypothetical protein
MGLRVYQDNFNRKINNWKFKEAKTKPIKFVYNSWNKKICWKCLVSEIFYTCNCCPIIKYLCKWNALRKEYSIQPTNFTSNKLKSLSWRVRNRDLLNLSFRAVSLVSINHMSVIWEIWRLIFQVHNSLYMILEIAASQGLKKATKNNSLMSITFKDRIKRCNFQPWLLLVIINQLVLLFLTNRIIFSAINGP